MTFTTPAERRIRTSVIVEEELAIEVGDWAAVRDDPLRPSVAAGWR